MQDGNLTVADLARWFDCPDPTVRGWVANGSEPISYDRRRVYDLLDTLEKLISKRKKFPMPRLSPSERIKRLRQIQKENWIN